VTASVGGLDTDLERLIRGTPWLLDVLEAVRAVDLPDAYVAAGAIRNTVWDILHGRLSHGPLGDVDVVYFDALDSHGRAESLLRTRLPQHQWEVTNQATVHRWQTEAVGKPIPAYGSVGEALASWPETATAVGVRLDVHGAIEVLAPFGLEDLFSMTVRPSPSLVDLCAYRSRVREKGWLDWWPKLTVVPLE
jgi:hypothetical protein